MWQLGFENRCGIGQLLLLLCSIFCTKKAPGRHSLWHFFGRNWSHFPSSTVDTIVEGWIHLFPRPFSFYHDKGIRAAEGELDGVEKEEEEEGETEWDLRRTKIWKKERKGEYMRTFSLLLGKRSVGFFFFREKNIRWALGRNLGGGRGEGGGGCLLAR